MTEFFYTDAKIQQFADAFAEKVRGDKNLFYLNKNQIYHAIDQCIMLLDAVFDYALKKSDLKYATDIIDLLILINKKDDKARLQLHEIAEDLRKSFPGDLLAASDEEFDLYQEGTRLSFNIVSLLGVCFGNRDALDKLNLPSLGEKNRRLNVNEVQQAHDIFDFVLTQIKTKHIEQLRKIFTQSSTQKLAQDEGAESKLVMPDSDDAVSMHSTSSSRRTSTGSDSEAEVSVNPHPMPAVGSRKSSSLGSIPETAEVNQCNPTDERKSPNIPTIQEIDLSKLNVRQGATSPSGTQSPTPKQNQNFNSQKLGASQLGAFGHGKMPQPQKHPAPPSSVAAGRTKSPKPGQQGSVS